MGRHSGIPSAFRPAFPIRPHARPVINHRAHPPPSSLAAERILVIRLGAVGDVVRTIPAVRALREARPDAHLSWLVEPGSASVLRDQPWLDDLIEFPRPALRGQLVGLRLVGAARDSRAFSRRLREERFDLVVDFHAILKSGVLSWLSRAPRRVTYARPFAREGAGLFATERADVGREKRSRFDRNEALIQYLGIPGAAAGAPLHLDAESVARASSALGPGPAPVAIHPGTSDSTAHKRWTVEGYAEVARGLAQGDGVASVVTVGPARDDRDFAEAVVQASRGAARLAPPTPALPDLAALLAACRLYVGGDTGPLHIASLVGTPVVQLLGPTDPVENQPFAGTPARRVRVQIGCNPCRRGCAAATCMRVLPPGEVLAAARQLLATPEGGCTLRPLPSHE